MNEPASFIHISNGELYDFEITYADGTVPFSLVATETHIVRQAKTIRHALVRFNRAVPGHGRIKSIRKLQL